jgi:light-regulated signal transduction histidine kinase (bacteriophytochrome)
MSPIFEGTPELDVLLAAGVVAVQSTPFVSRSGGVLGMVSTHYATEPRKPAERELRLMDILARQASDLIERAIQDDALRRSADQLRASNQALVRANDDLNQFAFAASHDLQEPLRMITSYSQLLLNGYRGDLGGEPGLCVDFISRGTKRMRDLLSDLLAYTQLSTDGQAEREIVDLNLVFQKALENLESCLEESKASVRSEHLPLVNGHSARFVQLFQNLIENAIKYRSDSAPEVSVRTAADGQNWHISVADNGIGIAPEYHARIFGVFKRLHGNRIPGTGIGLAICQRVVERYGGRIWVESDGKKGSTFHFTLPAPQENVAHAG